FVKDRCPDAAKLAKLVVSLRLFRCVSSREAELYGSTLKASTPAARKKPHKSISGCFLRQQIRAWLNHAQ
ncbi:hypothetical protein, partial [Chitinilyticum piscinae]|uniref:hypothetical protein n=1 Tax=Chitinilyticum piscinae TaxID=2866724 RepID=UPI001D16C27C